MRAFESRGPNPAATVIRSLCDLKALGGFHPILVLRFPLPGEGSKEGAPFSDQIPGQIESCSSIAGQFGEGGVGVGHGCKRGIEDVFIAAKMVLVAEATRGD